MIAKQHRRDVTDDPKRELRAHLRHCRQRIAARVIHVSVNQGRPFIQMSARLASLAWEQIVVVVAHRVVREIQQHS